MKPAEENQLVQEAIEEPEAIRALYRHYHPCVFGYVVSRVGSEQDAEDIVSEVFTRMVSGLHTFNYRGTGSFSAWLFQIARNETRRFYSKQHHKPDHVPLDSLPEIAADHIPPDQQLIIKEQFIHLQQCIRSLSPRRQEIVQLKFFAELRNNEIADVLGLDERTVASHLCRAIDDLRRSYQLEPGKSRHVTE